jgi:hypothetical protein
MNKRYQIERGIMEFSNPHRTEPVLNILLTTTISQYKLSLTFLGPLDKMQTSYVSVPPLPSADIINLIARGQTTQQAAASPSNLGASSLLAQGAASQVSSGVQKLADPPVCPSIRRWVATTQTGARVAMQKRITSGFLFTFATDVTSAQREIIQGEYKLDKRWSASVTRDENGGFAVDGEYHKRYIRQQGMRGEEFISQVACTAAHGVVMGFCSGWAPAVIAWPQSKSKIPQTADFVRLWCPVRWIQTWLANVRPFSNRHDLQDIRTLLRLTGTLS